MPRRYKFLAALAATAAFVAPSASAGNVAWSVSIGVPGFAISAAAPAYGVAAPVYGPGYAPVARPRYGYRHRRSYVPAPIVYGAPVVTAYPYGIAYPAPVIVAPRVKVPRRAVVVPYRPPGPVYYGWN